MQSSMPVPPLQGQWARAPVDARWRATQVRQRLRDNSALRGAAALLFCVFAGGVSAQISGTASVVSDYRYRGITLSDRKPAAQVGLTYDDPLGWYAGAFGSTVRLAPPAGPSFQATVFAGFASRVASGISLDAGADYSAFSGAADDNYGEVYLGVASENVSARIYYAPDYFGQHANAIYGEINAVQPLFDRVSFLLHLGFLTTRAYSPYSLYGPRSTQNVVDGRIGLGANFDLFRLELAWVGISNANIGYLIAGSRSPNTVVLTVSHAF
jgi:uncharacterized protein (TIGR02001 family)